MGDHGQSGDSPMALPPGLGLAATKETLANMDSPHIASAASHKLLNRLLCMGSVWGSARNNMAP